MLIVDRVENDVVVCEEYENENIVKIALKEIKNYTLKDGDILIKVHNGYVVDHEKTLLRRQKIIDKFNKLRN